MAPRLAPHDNLAPLCAHEMGCSMHNLARAQPPSGAQEDHSSVHSPKSPTNGHVRYDSYNPLTAWKYSSPVVIQLGRSDTPPPDVAPCLPLPSDQNLI